MSSWIMQNKPNKYIFKSNSYSSSIINTPIKTIKIIVGICTYPRDGIITYSLLDNTVSSLISSYNDISNISLKFVLIGDDYNNIEELKSIFINKQLDCDIFNININNALRNKKIEKEVIWMHSVTRSLIFLFNKVLEIYNDYDYLLLSADDELYINSMLKNNIEYIRKYNYPDFIFSLGIHPNNIIYPKNINRANLQLNYPEPENCTESGTLYKISNINFFNDIITFRSKRWNIIEEYIKNVSDYKIYNIKPEDAELWEYLNPKFKNKLYTSILIPLILINHLTEKTVFKYI